MTNSDKSKSLNIHIRVTPQLRHRLKMVAAIRGESMQTVIHIALTALEKELEDCEPDSEFNYYQDWKKAIRKRPQRKPKADKDKNMETQSQTATETDTETRPQYDPDNLDTCFVGDGDSDGGRVGNDVYLDRRGFYERMSDAKDSNKRYEDKWK